MRSALVLIVVFFATLSTPARIGYAETPTKLSPKVTFRLLFGQIKNTGTTSGSALLFGSPSLNLSYFLVPKFAVGVGYWAYVEIATQSVPIRAIDLFARYYYKGTGTRQLVHFSSGSVEKHDRLSLYAGGIYSYQFYYLGSNSSMITNIELSGSYHTASLALGADLRLSRNIEATAEFAYPLLAVSQTDDRIRIKGTFFSVGLSYLW